MTLEEIRNWFIYHAPKGDQASRYEEIRTAAKAFAITVWHNTPACPDQTVAIRTIREATMWANAAIACSESEPESRGPIVPSQSTCVHELGR